MSKQVLFCEKIFLFTMKKYHVSLANIEKIQQKR